MKNYFIEWSENGKTHTSQVGGSDPGHACAKFYADHPVAEIKRCFAQGRLAGNTRFPVVSLEYDVPSRAKVTPIPEEHLEQTCWDFK